MLCASWRSTTVRVVRALGCTKRIVGRQKSMAAVGQGEAPSGSAKGSATTAEAMELAALQHFKGVVRDIDCAVTLGQDFSLMKTVNSCFTSNLAQRRKDEQGKQPKEFQDAVAMARDQVQAYLDQVFPSALIHPKPSVRPSTAQVQGYLKAVLLKWYLTQCSGPDPLVPLFKMHVESVPKHLNAVLTLNAEDRLKAHLLLYGEQLTHPQLSMAMTALSTAIVSAWAEVLTHVTMHAVTASEGAAKRTKRAHLARVKRFERTVLSDLIELPLKVRCMYHWAERSKEVKASAATIKTPELVPVAVENLLALQQELFPQLRALCDTCSDGYLSQQRIWYDDRKKRRVFMMQAAGYFVVICVLDYVTYLI